MTRVLARSLARELTYEELAQVSGGDDPTNMEDAAVTCKATTYCHLNTPQQGPDDSTADFI